jgi:hypothetical protein
MHHLLACADDVNLLGDNIDALKKNTETLIDCCKEVGLEVNVKRIKNMLVSRHQIERQNHDMKIANISSEDAAPFGYLSTSVTNRNLIQEEIKRILISVVVCCHSVRNLSSSRLLFRDIRVVLHKLLFCLWFCMGAKLGL